MSTDNAILESLSAIIDRAVEAALERRSAEQPSQAQERPLPSSLPTFLTIQELAELLRLGTPDARGRRLGGIRTIRQWIAQNRIPCRRANGRVLFLTEEVLAWTALGGGRPSEVAQKNGPSKK